MSAGSRSGKPRAATKAKPAGPTKSRLAGPKPPSKPLRPAKPATSGKDLSAPAAPPTAPHPASPTDVAELKKIELIELVVARSEIKKKFAKPVIEAMLEVLGETIAKGREMNLQPLGKLKYNRSKETPEARVVITKIRQSKGAARRAKAANDTAPDTPE